MPGKFIFPFIIFSLIACTALKPAQEKGEVSGYIYLLKGNQMPSPGRPVSKGHGVSRDIYVYEPTTTSSAAGTGPLFVQVKTRLIAQTKSDSTGHYSLNLPTGKYSIFIKEDAGFFAAESDGKGVLNPVLIPANTTTQKNFTITLNAVY